MCFHHRGFSLKHSFGMFWVFSHCKRGHAFGHPLTVHRWLPRIDPKGHIPTYPGDKAALAHHIHIGSHWCKWWFRVWWYWNFSLCLPLCSHSHIPGSYIWSAQDLSWAQVWALVDSLPEAAKRRKPHFSAKASSNICMNFVPLLSCKWQQLTCILWKCLHFTPLTLTHQTRYVAFDAICEKLISTLNQSSAMVERRRLLVLERRLRATLEAEQLIYHRVSLESLSSD